MSTQAAPAGFPTLTDAELHFQPAQFDIVTAIEQRGYLPPWLALTQHSCNQGQ